MHEMSVAASIVEMVLEVCRDRGAGKVRSIIVDVGTFSGVEAGPLEFCFPAVAEGTLAAGAELVINRVTAQAKCPECDREFEPVGSAGIFQCPGCGALGSELVAGGDLLVREVILEAGESAE